MLMLQKTLMGKTRPQKLVETLKSIISCESGEMLLLHCKLLDDISVSYSSQFPLIPEQK